MSTNSRQAMRREGLDFAYPSETDRYNLEELKSTKRPYTEQLDEILPRAADQRGLTVSTDDE